MVGSVAWQPSVKSFTAGGVWISHRVQVLREANVQGALSTAPVLLLAARLLAGEEVLAICVPARDHLLDWDGEATVVDSDILHQFSCLLLPL